MDNPIKTSINIKNKKTIEELKKMVKKYNTKSINELWAFFQIEKGDIILAYSLNSTVAAVGEVIGDYSYNSKNKVGNDVDDDSFGYPHQKKVKWFETPRYFDKDELPSKITKKLGLRGKTTTEIKYPVDNFLKIIKEILSTHIRKFNEELVKAGLSKYVQKNLDQLELGLKITAEEKPIDEQNRPDFLAVDEKGSKIIIECKGYADKDDIKQIKRYRSNYPKAARCFLIASQISDECINEAQKNDIEVFEVDLNVKKIT